MLKRIQMFGAVLLVLAGLALASMEVVTPVVEARQQPSFTCCRVAENCAPGYSCETLESGVTCPAESVPYSRYCKVVSGGAVIPIGGDH